LILTVSQLNKFIKGVVDSEPLLSTLFVKGEVCDYKESRGSLYFSLKDENAKIDCFAYADKVCDIKNGISIIAEGYVNFLEQSGRISLRIIRCTHDGTEGAEYMKLMRLKEKLAGLGFFDPDKKRQVPDCCKKIGVVTSAAGAVIHDISKVVARRDPSVDIIVYDSRVQGVSAPAEIATGLASFNNQYAVDAVILARGGGSEEDLSAFNTEVVVRAIKNCPAPVISAIGHNIDYTFADYAADKRAATPTEAAELLTADINGAKQYALSLLSRIEQNCAAKMEKSKSDISAYSFLMNASSTRLLESIKSKAEQYNIKLQALNPKLLMSKGYTKILSDGKVVKSVDMLKLLQEVEFSLMDGTVKAQVTEKREDK
jgi:exodeoxyribonuclease VII large subunit